MSALGNAFADTYYVDGVVLKTRLSGADTRQVYLSALRQRLLELHPECDPKSFDAKFKVKIYYMDKDRYDSVVKVSMYGWLAESALQLRAGYLANLNEVHLKSHVFSLDPDWADRLQAALSEFASGGQQLALFGPKPKPHPEKGDGKGWRIGDRNSDYHFASYSRVGHRTGIEVRVQDAAVKRLANEALELAVNHGLSDESAWRVVFSKAAKVGADRFARDLELKCVAAPTFFSGFTTQVGLHENPVTYYSITDGQPYVVDLTTGEVSEGRVVQ